MESIMLYLIRTSVYLLIFSAGYYILVRKDSHPEINRAFILASFIVSMLLGSIPRVVLSGGISGSQQVVLLPELVVQAGEYSRQTSEIVAGNIISLTIIPWIIGFVSLMILLFLVVNLLRLFWLSRYNPRIDREGMQVVLLSNPVSPFSFFHYVFVPERLLSLHHFPKVLAHEKAHWLQGHSWDLLLMEFARVLLWFHPAWYLLNRELRAQHEYQADRIACRGLKKSEYQLTLLEYTLSGSLIPLSNPFNVSLTKKRIMMMNKSTRKPATQIWLKTLVVLPFLVLALIVQSCQLQNSDEVNPSAMSQGADSSVKDTEAEAFASEKIFTVVENNPLFPGGTEELMNYLRNNTRYPKAARDAGHAGTVFVTFVVTKEGKIKDVTVLRGVSPELDDEAIRVISMMPDWIPGTQRGEAVNVQYNIPIRFHLPEDSNHAVIVFE